MEVPRMRIKFLLVAMLLISLLLAGCTSTPAEKKVEDKVTQMKEEASVTQEQSTAPEVTTETTFSEDEIDALFIEVEELEEFLSDIEGEDLDITL